MKSIGKPRAVEEGARKRNLLELVSRVWQTKLALTLVLPIAFCVFYFLLQHLTEMRVTTFKLTSVDRWIQFQPEWIWVYQSVYLAMPIAPWLAASKRELRRYGEGFVLLSLIGFGIFSLYPVAAPRPTDVPAHEMYALLITYDGIGNAFPSLHCALTFYHLLFAEHTTTTLLSRRGRLLWRVIGGFWTAAICYSTLATKQHYFVDVVAGLVLATAVHAVVWTERTRATSFLALRRPAAVLHPTARSCTPANSRTDN